MFDPSLLEFERVRVHHRHCRPRVDANKLCAEREADPGTNNSPPPSDLASSLLERGGRRALLSSSRSLAATPPECGGSHTLFSSPVHDAPVRAKEWDGAGSAQGGAARYQFGRLGDIYGAGEFPINHRKPSLTSGYSTFKHESCNTKEELGTTRGEPYDESIGRRTRGRIFSRRQDKTGEGNGETQAGSRPEGCFLREQSDRTDEVENPSHEGRNRARIATRKGKYYRISVKEEETPPCATKRASKDAYSLAGRSALRRRNSVPRRNLLGV